MGTTLTNWNNVPKESFANKVKNVAETVGTIKGLYDTGKIIYSGIRTVAPIVRAVAGFL